MELAALKSAVDAGFRESHRRFDEQNERLAVIDEKVTKTNGTVIRHEEQIKTLFERVRELPRDVVTVRALTVIKDFGGWVVAGVLGLLKLMGKL